MAGPLVVVVIITRAAQRIKVVAVASRRRRRRRRRLRSPRTRYNNILYIVITTTGPRVCVYKFVFHPPPRQFTVKSELPGSKVGIIRQYLDKNVGTRGSYRLYALLYGHSLLVLSRSDMILYYTRYYIVRVITTDLPTRCYQYGYRYTQLYASDVNLTSVRSVYRVAPLHSGNILL